MENVIKKQPSPPVNAKLGREASGAAFTSPMYQTIVGQVRDREDSPYSRSWGWGSHHGDAVSRYPNIAAILAARRWEISDYTPYVPILYMEFCKVLDSGEALGEEPMRYLAWKMGVSVDYLRAPVLSVIDPRRHKDLQRVQELDLLLRDAASQGIPLSELGRRARAHVEAVRKGLFVPFEEIDWPTVCIRKALPRWKAEVLDSVDRIRTAVQAFYEDRTFTEKSRHILVCEVTPHDPQQGEGLSGPTDPPQPPPGRRGRGH